MGCYLHEAQRPSFVHILSDLKKFYTVRHYLFIHNVLYNFGAKLHFFFQKACTIHKKRLPLHRISEEESSELLQREVKMRLYGLEVWVSG